MSDLQKETIREGAQIVRHMHAENGAEADRQVLEAAQMIEEDEFRYVEDLQYLADLLHLKDLLHLRDRLYLGGLSQDHPLIWILFRKANLERLVIT
ncbi:hypothetical protein MXB_3047 [Myxobolus squamalis]|nr:hypothetical protein MXB_3047 [Myxobolus squamalis]